jgi:hypothetical protein
MFPISIIGTYKCVCVSSFQEQIMGMPQLQKWFLTFNKPLNQFKACLNSKSLEDVEE